MDESSSTKDYVLCTSALRGESLFPLDNVWNILWQTSLTAASGMISVVVCRMASHLRNCAAWQPKGAAAVLATLATILWNGILGANMSSRANHNKKHVKEEQRANESTKGKHDENPRWKGFHVGLRNVAVLVDLNRNVWLQDNRKSVVKGHVDEKDQSKNLEC